MGGKRLTGKQIASISEASQASAESCCTCRRCKKPASHAVQYDWVCKLCRPLQKAEEDETIRRIKAAEEARAKAWAESLKLAKDECAASMLCSRMSELSEEYYCASWLNGCEFTLWGFVVDGPGAWGLGEFQKSEADELRILSETAGGWIVWDDAVCGNLFVAADEWRARWERAR